MAKEYPPNWNKMSHEDRALWELINAGDEFVAGGPAQYQAGEDLSYQELDPYQLAQLRKSALSDINTDPRLRDAQLDALNQLQQVSETGMTARDEADLLRLKQDVSRQNRGRAGAIQQNMASRGMSGSGLDLVAQMQAAQDATEREALAALEKNAQIGERKQQAMMQRGQLAGQMRGQEFGEAAAKAQADDAIDRFNTANMVDTQNRNQLGRNQALQANWQRQNQTSDRNSQAGYDFRKDQMGVQQQGAEFKYNKATDDYNRAQARKARNAGRGGRMLSGAAQGASAGAAFGPWGAVAGGVIGAAANYAQGKVRGEAPFPGNDPRNDLYPAMVSADEIIVPREEAQDPTTAAAFAAQAAAEPQDQFSSIKNPMVRDYMRQKYAARKEMEGAQRNQDILSAVNAGGRVLTDAMNNQREDVILKNRLSDLGKAPQVLEAKRNEWDGSTLDKLGALGVQRAKDKFAQVDQDFATSSKIRELDRAELLNDPASEESRQAREYLKQIAPGVADKMSNFDNLTAAQVQKVAPGLFDKYKTDVSESNTDKRLKAQAEAEERRTTREYERQDKKDREQRYRRSVDIRKELSKNPAYANAVEADLRLAQVDELMKNPNGVSDEAILVMYQKTLDPGSVVREGEFARTAAGQSLIGRVDNIMQQAATGKRLTPELRKQVVDAMKSIQAGNKQALQRALSPYEREIRDYDLDRSIIMGGDSAPESTPSASGNNSNRLNSAKDLP